MMKLTVKVVGKEISGPSGKFTTYSVLSGAGKWYRVAKIDKKELEAYKGQVATISISRKFDKTFESKGEERTMPTLVVEDIRVPDEKDEAKFNDQIDKLNAETLKDVI